MVIVNSACNSIRKRTKQYMENACSVETVNKRIPILGWLPNYTITFLIQDIIAGVTVGLTAIPQGIAYAVVAGLSPEYGLYAGLLGGVTYAIFGSCRCITIGPTAIMSALTAKYVSGYSADFAVLAAFLSGLTILAMGIFHLGFLVEFISQPVITGFTTAAALQIASAQLKSLFGLTGSSGNYFAESVTNFVHNVKTIQIWDTSLGFSTIIILLLLKKLGNGCSRTGSFVKQFRWFISLARNAVVVIIGVIIAYILKVTLGREPLTLTGDIGSGLPALQPPPFSTVVGNTSYTFSEMVAVLGPEAIILPLVAVLESVAIAKAFAGGLPVDATQEMIATFVSSMPVTGSFTRSALNHASGVQTTAGGIFTGLIILLALSLLTSTFYYIPKPTLAGLIITAMFSMIEYPFFARLWKNSKKELFVFLVTIALCLTFGLEYGIVIGILLEAALLLFTTARPTVDVKLLSSEKGDVIIIPLIDSLSYCAAEHLRRSILSAANGINVDTLIIVDGTNLKRMDTTVASNLMSVIGDVGKKSVKVQLMNFKSRLMDMCINLCPDSAEKFVTACNPLDLVNSIPKTI